MVKIRDDLPKKADGSIDIQSWVERIAPSRLSDEKNALHQAAQLAASVNEICLYQGLLTAETLLTLEPDINTLLAAIT